MAWKYNPRNKYSNKKVIVNGMKFDSKMEAQRWHELNLLQKAGEIYNLQRQVKFELIPTQREPDTVGKRGGIHKGKVIERECYYVADFTYYVQGSNRITVEDTKGAKTEGYIIKRKLMLYVHGIKIKEVKMK